MRLDFEAIAAAAGGFGGDECRTAAQERIVNSFRSVIEDCTPRKFHRLLCAVSSAIIFWLERPALESVVCRIPNCALCTVSSPVSIAAFTHGIPARFMLAVIVSPANNEMRLT